MCLDLLCCCFGPAACGLCCCGGKVKNSVTTRLLYSVFLVAVVAVTAIMLSPTVAHGLQKAVSEVYPPILALGSGLGPGLG